MFNTLKLVAFAAGLFLAVTVSAAEIKKPELAPVVEDIANINSKQLAAACAKLDNPKERQRMDGLLYKLLILCDRQSELGRVKSEKFKNQVDKAPGTDSIVNDPTGEFSASQTQNETSLARNEVTGTLCSGFNDSFSGVTTTGGFTGFARSTDDGASFDDGGALSANSFGDPSLVWNRADGNFYFAALHSNGLGLWRSTDDCGTFPFIGMIHSGTGDDKEILTVDNNPASPFYGRMHVSWTDFDSGARIFNTFTTNFGASWSSPVGISASGADVQGAWPAVAPDGTVYVTWVRWNPYFTGPIDVEVTRSTNGGASFTQVTNPLSGAVNPYQSAATNNCTRPALGGNIRYLPSPQMVVAPNGDVAVVYSYDPDGRDVGDIVDVFFRRSTDQGATWEPEIQLNDDGTTRDQFFPTLSVGPSGRYVAAWYDRRLDVNNSMLDYYARLSEDGGVTWNPSERVSDVSSPIYIDPGLASCYHGDYDQQVQSEAAAYLQWADDRAVRNGHNDPDTYLDKNILAADFSVAANPGIADVCAPESASYTINIGQSLGFNSPITLTSSGLPLGTIDGFSVNPVTPPNASTMSIDLTGSPAPGTYTVDVDGTDGIVVHSTQVVYSLSTATPTIPSLTSPVNSATEQSATPLLEWDAVPQQGTYFVELATDVAFTNVIETATVSTNSYQVAIALSPESEHFWRVSGANSCGGGPTSFVSSFTTAANVCSSNGIAITDLATNSGSLPLTSTGIIDSLTVSIDADHTWVGDVMFTLTHEDSGTSVVLMDRPGAPTTINGCSSDDIDAEFDDNSAIDVETECNSSSPAIGGVLNPTGTLGNFVGEILGGTWRLDVFDGAGGDQGTVNEWCLKPVLQNSAVDTDNDTIDDSVDNCTLIANADQRDTNNDGYGNACDPDLDNNGIVNFGDVSSWVPFFNTACGDVDQNFDNATSSCNFGDYALFPAFFQQPPGPAAIDNQ